MDLRDLEVIRRQNQSAALSTSGTAVVTGLPVSGVCTINATGSDEQAWWPINLSAPLIGDVVGYDRPRSGRLIVTTQLVPGAAAVPPMAPQIPAMGTTFCPATASYSWPWDEISGVPAGVVWTGETRLRQGTPTGGTPHCAAWYYGAVNSYTISGPVAASLLSDATVVNAQIRVCRTTAGPASAAQVHLYQNGFLGGALWPPQAGGPEGPANPEMYNAGSSVLNVSLKPGEAQWVTLPAAWWPLLVSPSQILSGYSYYVGLMIRGEPYLELTSVEDDPESGLVRIDWIR